MSSVCLRTAQALALAAALVLAGGARAASDDVAVLRARLAETLEQIQAQCREKKAQCLPAYGGILAAAEKKAQMAGNLDLLVAVRAERARFEKEKTVPATPDAAAGQYVEFFQSFYRKSLADAEREKDKAIVAAAKQYVERLEEHKRELTRQGKVENALQVKSEQDAVAAIPIVAAAESALASAAAGPQPALLGTACAACGGTGEAGAKCSACGGTGKCASCLGQGMRMAGLKGGEMIVPCGACDKTGKCRSCGGTGKAKREPCPACGGLGRTIEVAAGRTVAAATTVPPDTVSTNRDAVPPQETTLAEAPTVAVNAPPGTEAAASGAKATLENLREAFRGGKAAEAADLADVFDRREAYAGKVLSSKCLLTGSAPRVVYVRVEMSRTSSISCSMRASDAAVVEKAQALLGSGGDAVRVNVTYGVDEAGDRHAFDIVRAAD